MKILDTDVCIEILRGNVRVIERRRRTLDEVATTWITACERIPALPVEDWIRGPDPA